MRFVVLLSLFIILGTTVPTIGHEAYWPDGVVPQEAIDAAVECVKDIVGENLFESSVTLNGGGPLVDGYRVAFLLHHEGIDYGVPFGILVGENMHCRLGLWGFPDVNNVPKCAENPNWCKIAITSLEAESIALTVGLGDVAGDLTTELVIGGGRKDCQLVWKVTLVLNEKEDRISARVVEVGAFDGEVVSRYSSMDIE